MGFEMINICIFNGDMSRSGGTERITQVLSGLLAKNYKYCVWVLNLNNATGKSYYTLDEKVRFVTLKTGGLVTKNLAMLEFVYKNKIDVVINVDIMLGIFSLPAIILRPRTKLISWEMFNIRNDIGSRHTKTVRQLSLWLSRYYITQTKSDMEAFINELQVACPITYIYNPCIGEIQCDGYDGESKTIVTAGHFYHTKGYDLAVEVAKIVFYKHPDWKWEFYGEGERLDIVKSLVKEYELEQNIIFCGRTSRIIEAYKNSAMYVMTSRSEGFGLVLTEAKSCNLPTVAFDVDFGPREIIEHEVSGYLVEAFDIETMAQRICELIEDKEKRLSFSRHAKDNLSLFSLETFEYKWNQIIDEVCGRIKRRR